MITKIDLQKLFELADIYPDLKEVLKPLDRNSIFCILSSEPENFYAEYWHIDDVDSVIDNLDLDIDSEKISLEIKQEILALFGKYHDGTHEQAWEDLSHHADEILECYSLTNNDDLENGNIPRKIIK